MMIRIREAAVAGSFYPVDPVKLRDEVEHLLDRVSGPPPASAAEAPPKALVVPHAGYIYSGPIAASAYARLRRHRDRYHRVALLGPSHHVAVEGLAASGDEAFHTPLGDVPLDRVVIEELERRHPAVAGFDAAHLPEHSLEVQLPFLQVVLGAFTLVPLLAGNATAETVAAVIERLWEQPGTLVVVSSDLSHYLDYAAARRCDAATMRSVESLDSGGIGAGQACGAVPLRGLLLAARRHGLRAVTLDLRNSADTAGGRDRVVGYGAWMLTEDAECQHSA